MNTNLKQKFKLGTTLFSFTNEYWSREFTFEQLVRKVGELNLGPGLEVIGFQSIRGFPEVSDDFAARFRDLVAEYKLELSSLAVNVDVWARRGGAPLSVDETVAYLDPQIRAAKKLGFPVARSQLAATLEVVERLLPLVEKLGLSIGPELHAPWTIDSPAIVACRELYARLRSPLLGFIPDFGFCAKAWPALICGSSVRLALRRRCWTWRWRSGTARVTHSGSAISSRDARQLRNTSLLQSVVWASCSAC